jgi:hypothetical protein
VFGNMDSLKKPHLEELCTFDRLEEERGLDSEEKFGKSLISSNLEKITLKEISWRQKSRVLRLKEVDKCTKFFHGLANSNPFCKWLNYFQSTNYQITLFNSMIPYFQNYN